MLTWLAVIFFPGWPRRETPLANHSPEREAFGTRLLVFKRQRLGLVCWFLRSAGVWDAGADFLKGPL